MATKRWSTKGFKVSNDTKDLKKKYNTSNQNYTNYVNKGVQTSPQTTQYWNDLQTLQKSNKLSNTFNYGNQAGYNNALNALTNREAFKYDLSNDQLYQQAKDQYQQMGKTAMADTIGQASAMTGGYGNSYATTAGSQAYQSYLQQLNNNIADYYNLALGAYNSETDRLQGNFNAFATDRGQQASEWAQNWGVYNERFNNLANAWANSRDYDLNAYNTQASQLGNVNAQNYNAYNDSENRDVDIWKISNDNLISLYGLRDNWEQNQKENELANRQINETIRSNKANEKETSRGNDLNQQQIGETIRHNKETEKETKRANNLSFSSKVTGVSNTSSKSGNKSGNNGVSKTYLNKVISFAGKMLQDGNYAKLANYLNNLGSEYDSEIPSILNSIGLSSTWLSDFYNGKISTKQK